MISIQEISSNKTFEVRHPVLRNEKPIESCRFDGDDLTSTVHFGLFIKENLIGVVSVFKNKSRTFNIETQYQIRGMAVLFNHQRNGFGEMLMLHCEKYILEQKGTLIWFNARENAVPFYEKLNYKKNDHPFTIKDIGLHYLMTKEIIEIAHE